MLRFGEESRPGSFATKDGSTPVASGRPTISIIDDVQRKIVDARNDISSLRNLEDPKQEGSALTSIQDQSARQLVTAAPQKRDNSKIIQAL